MNASNCFFLRVTSSAFERREDHIDQILEPTRPQFQKVNRSASNSPELAKRHGNLDQAVQGRRNAFESRC